MKCEKDCPSQQLRDDVIRTAEECAVRRAAFEEAWAAHAERSKRRAEALEVLAVENADLRRRVEELSVAAKPPQLPPQVRSRSVKLQVSLLPARSESVSVRAAPDTTDHDVAAMQLVDRILSSRTASVERELALERESHARIMRCQMSLLAIETAECSRRAAILSTETCEFVSIGSKLWAAISSELQRSAKKQHLTINLKADSVSRACRVLAVEASLRSDFIACEAIARQELAAAACAALMKVGGEFLAAVNSASKTNDARWRMADMQFIERERSLAAAWGRLEAQRADLEAARALMEADAVLARSPVPVAPETSAVIKQSRIGSSTTFTNRKNIELVTSRATQLAHIFERMQRAAEAVDVSLSFASHADSSLPSVVDATLDSSVRERERSATVGAPVVVLHSPFRSMKQETTSSSLARAR